MGFGKVRFVKRKIVAKATEEKKANPSLSFDENGNLKLPDTFSKL